MGERFLQSTVRMRWGLTLVAGWALIAGCNEPERQSRLRMPKGQVALADLRAVEEPAGAAKPAPPKVSPAQPRRTGAGTHTYTVLAGDTWFRIGQKLYGDGKQWRAIAEANRQKVGPSGVLIPGTVLVIPDIRNAR